MNQYSSESARLGNAFQALSAPTGAIIHSNTSNDFAELSAPKVLGMGATGVLIDPSEWQITKAKEQINGIVSRNDSSIITSEPGSGKTLGLPLLFAEPGKLIVISEPRRINCEESARNLSSIVGCELGTKVGYAHGQGTCFDPKSTEILYCTDGYEVTRQLMSGKVSPRIKMWIVDEAHEMSSSTIILLALAKRHVSENPGKKLIVTSGTLDSELFSKYLNDAPSLYVPGRLHPITDIEPTGPKEREIAKFVKQGLTVLSFERGKREILALERNLREMGIDSRADIFPFHADLPMEHLARALKPSDRPRVIISTNAGETGLTPRANIVMIDGGYRESDIVDGSEALVDKPLSQSMYTQQRNRVGRTEDGICVNFGPPKSELPNDSKPEITRSLIERLALELLFAKEPIETLDLVARPTDIQIKSTYRQLKQLGLVVERDSNFTLTKLGEQVVKLPINVRSGIMLAQALTREEQYPGITKDLIDLAAVSETGYLIDPREFRKWRKIQTGEERSDLLNQVAILRLAETSGDIHKWCEAHGVKERLVQRAIDAKERISKRIGLPEENKNSSSILPRDWSNIYRRQIDECVWHAWGDKTVEKVQDGLRSATGKGIWTLPKYSVSKNETLVVGRPFSISLNRELVDPDYLKLIVLPHPVCAKWLREHSANLPKSVKSLAFGKSGDEYAQRKETKDDPHRSRKLGKNGKRGQKHIDGRRR